MASPKALRSCTVTDRAFRLHDPNAAGTMMDPAAFIENAVKTRQTLLLQLTQANLSGCMEVLKALPFFFIRIVFMTLAPMMFRLIVKEKELNANRAPGTKAKQDVTYRKEIREAYRAQKKVRANETDMVLSKTVWDDEQPSPPPPSYTARQAGSSDSNVAFSRAGSVTGFDDRVPRTGNTVFGGGARSAAGVAQANIYPRPSAFGSASHLYGQSRAALVMELPGVAAHLGARKARTRTILATFAVLTSIRLALVPPPWKNRLPPSAARAARISIVEAFSVAMLFFLALGTALALASKIFLNVLIFCLTKTCQQGTAGNTPVSGEDGRGHQQRLGLRFYGKAGTQTSCTIRKIDPHPQPSTETMVTWVQKQERGSQAGRPTLSLLRIELRHKCRAVPTQIALLNAKFLHAFFY
ncbi:hypothetical protein EDB81DRAFT_883253 [Dactylonectria macrodidyma]|uniref:Uncharacterized protein n=1 Tax=Dactylonectria macrodidyma TaxID=307937 RepID=A0A9P9EVX9_9HYPO|nr:hypothetical protein EDB81DRAFT_883253 [Dactylonectria macrodidyma]